MEAVRLEPREWGRELGGGEKMRADWIGLLGLAR